MYFNKWNIQRCWDADERWFARDVAELSIDPPDPFPGGGVSFAIEQHPMRKQSLQQQRSTLPLTGYRKRSRVGYSAAICAHYLRRHGWCKSIKILKHKFQLAGMQVFCQEKYLKQRSQLAGMQVFSAKKSDAKISTCRDASFFEKRKILKAKSQLAGMQFLKR